MSYRKKIGKQTRDQEQVRLFELSDTCLISPFASSFIFLLSFPVAHPLKKNLKAESFCVFSLRAS
jgi:hypothetical protein